MLRSRERLVKLVPWVTVASDAACGEEQVNWPGVVVHGLPLLMDARRAHPADLLDVRQATPWREPEYSWQVHETEGGDRRARRSP